jgi:serine/threonine protein kinase
LSPEILPHEINKVKKLGKGNYGQVWLGSCRGDNVAIKLLSNKLVDEDTINEFKNECEILMAIRHPNIVLFMGACLEKNNLAIVTEYVPFDLESLLEKKEKEMSIIQKVTIMKEIALGMNWLHSFKPPIIHRDLKPNNILLDSDHHVKICDFGLSIILQNKKIADWAGSYIWMAPEELMNTPYDEKVDVYSYAIVCWQIYTRCTEPFKKYIDQKSIKNLIKAVCKGNERPEIPEETPESLKNFLNIGWHKNPASRPSFSEIIEMMDENMLNCITTYNNAVLFWLNYWKGKTEAKFSQFAEELYYSVYLPLPTENLLEDFKYLSLLAILCENKDVNSMVTLEKFALALKWFGDLKESDSNIIDSIYKIVKNPWFHGNITREEATDVLTKKKRKPGTFLVRLSSSEPIESNPFTLSKLTKDGKVQHHRIYKAKEEGKEVFSLSIPTEGDEKNTKIVADNLTKLIDLAIEKFRFKNSVIPRKKFADIFNEKNDEDNDEGYIEEVFKYK